MTSRAGAVVAWRCAVCAATLDVAAPHPFTCPRASASDRHHVLHPVVAGPDEPALDSPNPFVAYGPRLAWWAFARAHGMTEAACVALTLELAEGFAVTPYARSAVLADAVGGDVWVKDETGNVAGSHKARHLVSALLHLRAAEALGLSAHGARPPLALASCGNAAIAAATLARRAEWPLQVFVPEWAEAPVLTLIERLGAAVTVCSRREDDPPGDPAVLRFREAVAGGAVPFGVQGPENALCLDGGRTIGWEMADAPEPPTRLVVQVGGGALATCAGWGLGPTVRLDTVQTEGCAPLARAWDRAAAAGLDAAAVVSHWADLMTPWAQPCSVADGILDDETYDWLGVFDVMRASGGRPLVVPEDAVVRAVDLAQATGVPVSATGSAGLAALLTESGASTPDERVAVVFSGVAR